MSKLLDSINSPSDIKALEIKQLKQLCSEIRDYMVEVCSDNPGHLASSLGAVEMIVATHYVFDTPNDKFVIDVGHQAYAHKILSERKDGFKTLRKEKGLSGFPNMFESKWDAFGVGHSSTSISAALGYAEAFRIQGSSAKSIAMIGDGAMSGGLAYEAMNNAGVSQADLLILLNDNNQSIDKAVGALNKHLLRITTSSRYNFIKRKTWDILGAGCVRDFLQRWTRSVKSWLVKSKGGDIFEALGLRYFGPIDGNDVEQLVKVLRKLKGMKGVRVLHCLTAKGKGYLPAEQDPTTWHAPGKFDPVTGERKLANYDVCRFQDVFGKVLCELARKDERIVGITPAMASGCSMTTFAKEFPSRFFDVGIEEEHAVTFSAGLAAAGLKPVCNIYSSFSQRAYDQIVHDVALQKLPVVLCFDRAGVVGEDGATHNGAFDLACYRNIPNCIIAAPSDELELKQLMYTALQSPIGPYIIRYPRGLAQGVEWENAAFEALPVGKARLMRKGSKVAIVALGPCVYDALRAAESLAAESASDKVAGALKEPCDEVNNALSDVAVYDFRFLKPIDTAALDYIAATYETVLTVEDGSLKGGLYGEVSEYFHANSFATKVYGLGIPDEFIKHATQTAQRSYCGIDKEGIEKKLRELN